MSANFGLLADYSPHPPPIANPYSLPCRPPARSVPPPVRWLHHRPSLRRPVLSVCLMKVLCRVPEIVWLRKKKKKRRKKTKENKEKRRKKKKEKKYLRYKTIVFLGRILRFISHHASSSLPPTPTPPFPHAPETFSLVPPPPTPHPHPPTPMLVLVLGTVLLSLSPFLS